MGGRGDCGLESYRGDARRRNIPDISHSGCTGQQREAAMRQGTTDLLEAAAISRQTIKASRSHLS